MRWHRVESCQRRRPPYNEAKGSHPGPAVRLHRDVAGSTAAEFAMVAPLFLLLMFGTVAYSTLMTTCGAIEQLVAEGARASVGGLSDTERDQLARSFITANLGSYPFLNPQKLAVSTATVAGTVPAFRVTVNYDMSASFIYQLSGLMPLPSSAISRSAVVQANS